MRIFLSIVLISINQLCDGQAFQSRVSFGVIYDHFIVHKIPSYVQRYGIPFDIQNDGIRNKSKSSASVELGFQVQKNWKGTKKFFSGLILGYRQTRLSYVNHLESYLEFTSTDIKEVFFVTDIDRNFLMIQIPIGVIMPLTKKLSFDFSARNNLIFPVVTKQSVRDSYFEFNLENLDTRSPSKYLLEISPGFRYAWDDYSLSIKYIQGLTPLYPSTKNAYNELIPSKLYFSSIELSIDLNIQSILSLNQKR